MIQQSASEERHDTGGVHDPFPLTATQEAYLVGRDTAMRYGSVGCHGYWEWESTTADPTALATAWRALVARHPALRTVMCAEGGQRVLADPPEWEVTVNDWAELDPQEAERRLTRLRADRSRHVFDPLAFPLWDVQVSLLPGGRRRVHFSLDLLVADAWSYFHVLVPELTALYRGESPGPAPRRTFRDFVLERHHREATGPEWRRAEEYWTKRLDTLPPAPMLPQPPSAAGDDTRFVRLEDALDTVTWERLQKSAARRSVTPTALLAAVFAEVLRAWGGGDDFVVNVPVFPAIRAGDAYAGVVGDFTSTVLLEMRGEGATFTDRARQAQRQMWEDLPHSDFSGIHVARALARRRGRTEVGFPVVLTSLLGQPGRETRTDLGESVYTSTQTPQVSLDFQVAETGGELRWSWDHRAAAFPPGMVRAMFGAFGRLLRRLAGDAPAWEEERFDLIPPDQAERRRAGNATDAPVPREPLTRALLDGARRHPHRPAVVSADGEVLSRGELAERALGLAAVLAEPGRPGVPVAVLLPKGRDQIVAAHGVTNAGLAYLPLDVDQPDGRLRAVLREAGVTHVVTDRDRERRARGLGAVTVVRVDEPYGREPLPDGLATATGDAYVILTSGSTGTPKGVVVPHRGAANAFGHMNELLRVSADDRVLAVSGFHFDLSVYDVFGILMAGGAAVVPDGDRGVDPGHWLELIRSRGVTVWNSAPALFELVVHHAEQHRIRLDGLRAVVLAGDWIPVDLPARAERVFPNVSVVASGGPAETCVWSIVNPLPRGYVCDGASIPYGVPMRNQRYFVLDGEGREVPDWVTGEMCVESPVGLARGYLGAESSPAFRPRPGSRTPAYWTGDLGRWRPDGSIEFMGRRDLQVKIDGVRVEPAETEAVLRRHPATRDAVVSAREVAGGKRLVAHVVPEPGRPVSTRELLDHAAAHLPRAAVPAAVEFLDVLPLNANGKVDRLALSRRDLPAEPVRAGAGRVSGPVESVLALVWAEALDLAGEADPEASFFHLGGTSLQAARMTTRIGAVLDLDVDARLVFTHPTLREQAAALAEGEHGPRVLATCRAVLDTLADDSVS
ncbi:amino acid adenylation domain-containing protein [Streptomyces sp. NPDC057176]|uniref:non-ribosomal peptide synthetase n=1 Tax=Streptomyces sp. NPDC057176 TaxID=3346036 RepID=UPI0036320A4C